MTSAEYQEYCKSVRPHWTRGLQVDTQEAMMIHYTLGISGEAGEITDAVKKHIVYGKQVDIENIIEECGDIMWYISNMLTIFNCTIEEAMQKNVDKLKKRYPKQVFTQEDALARADKKLLCPVRSDGGEHDFIINYDDFTKQCACGLKIDEFTRKVVK